LCSPGLSPGLRQSNTVLGSAAYATVSIKWGSFPWQLDQRQIQKLSVRMTMGSGLGPPVGFTGRIASGRFGGESPKVEYFTCDSHFCLNFCTYTLLICWKVGHPATLRDAGRAASPSIISPCICIVDTAGWTLRLWDTSPTGQFAYCLVISPTYGAVDTSPTGHFTYWTVRLLCGQFAYWTLRSLKLESTCKLGEESPL